MPTLLLYYKDMLFANNKDTTKYGVLFEVGSGSVAGAIVSSSTSNKHPVILYATREFLSLKHTVATEDMNKRLLPAFLTTAMDIEAKLAQYLPKKIKPRAIFVNFSAPWSHTRSDTHTFESEIPVLITEKLLEQIKVTAAKKVSSEVKVLNTLKDSNFTLINRVIIGHTANSYPINNPVGQTVKTITTTETLSAVANVIFTPVYDIINKLFTNTRIQFSTSSLVQQHLLHTKINTPSTFATLHLTHEALELILYREHKIIAAFSAPIGINTMARNISEASRLPHEQVFSFLTAEDTTAYQDATLKKIQIAFEKLVLTPLAEFFSNAQSSELLPRDFYLITTMMPSPAIINIVTEALKKSGNNRFIVHNLYTPIVHNTAKANLGSNDLGICSLAYFFHNSSLND